MQDYTPCWQPCVYWCVRVSLPQIIVAQKGMIVASFSAVHFRLPDW